LQIRAFYAATGSWKKTKSKFGISLNGTLHRLLNRRHIGGIPGIKEVEANKPIRPVMRASVTAECDVQPSGNYLDTV
jgi:hypothetical protein